MRAGEGPARCAGAGGPRIRARRGGEGVTVGQAARAAVLAARAFIEAGPGAGRLEGSAQASARGGERRAEQGSVKQQIRDQIVFCNRCPWFDHTWATTPDPIRTPQISAHGPE